ncbi:hypothetical protein CO2235_U1030003 [Cupriavidus oxalaticus]|uniref:Uncharacterized protein n=1 Tax=Cupriavidus oxalaticus TaxID=96344 RepID=A0A375FPK7_9BURK|nr:hypothetical protein CO2235_U1030003 [Cupriavidus oxalaticus]
MRPPPKPGCPAPDRPAHRRSRRPPARRSGSGSSGFHATARRPWPAARRDPARSCGASSPARPVLPARFLPVVRWLRALSSIRSCLSCRTPEYIICSQSIGNNLTFANEASMLSFPA